ncbi:MAG: hypothetical protein JXR83_15735, partial [Deltaproteobacteria bacterium]|nr:hypothetical protein [Deltaproteobacteria bacterium]
DSARPDRAGPDRAAADAARADLGLDDDGGGADSGPPPLPADIDPCENGSCWSDDAWAPPCGYAPVDEDYSSGRYNVHEYRVVLYHDAPIRITVDRTAGTWQPAIIVVTAAGEVVSDGAVALQRPGLNATIAATGRTGARARLRLNTGTDTPASVFVTGWGAIDSGFTEFQPQTAEYSLLIESRCVANDNVGCTIYGSTLSKRECAWIHYIGRYVVPRLAGTREQRLDAAAAVGWWTYKEAVLRIIDNPLSYSNCSVEGVGDTYIGPVDLCATGRAWQVGLSAVQVPDHTDSAVATVQAQLYPGESAETILAEAARVANLDAATTAAVVGSTGYLRRSWLLRTSPIGFALEAGPVTSQCINSTRTWCPDNAKTRASVADVREILDAVAP